MGSTAGKDSQVELLFAVQRVSPAPLTVLANNALSSLDHYKVKAPFRSGW